MSLALRTLWLKNWKCYRSQQIDFGAVHAKNVWIVFGKNGYGKTSILEALRWCLYGATAIAPSELVSRFNRTESNRDPDIQISVQLALTVDTEVHEISRSAKRIQRGKSITAQIDEPIYKIDGVKKDDSRERIEFLLPEACSQFFFFDGVEIKRYAQRVHSQDMRDAIERVLGIPELRNLRYDSQKAMEQLDDELEKLRAVDPELERVVKRLTELSENAKTLRDQLDDAKQSFESSIAILEEAQTEASQYDALRGRIEERDRLRREESRASENLDILEREIQDALRQAPIAMLLPFIRQASDELQRTTYTSARRQGYSTFLSRLLESSVCVCGRPIDKDAHKCIESELSKQGGTAEAGMDIIRQDRLRMSVDALAQFRPPDLELLYEKRDAVANDLEEAKQALRRLKSELGDIQGDDPVNVWRRVGEAEYSVKEKRGQVDRLTQAVAASDSEIDKMRREQEKLASGKVETRALAECSKLARGLNEISRELVDWRLAESRGTIQQATTDEFLRVTNKPKEYAEVVVDSTDYSIRVKNVLGEELNPETLSAGEREALAFSFIAGLNIASGKSAPFVMDTPFGHLDAEHQRNLVRSLPSLPSQVVVLATDRDFPDQLMEAIAPHIAGVSRIKRLSPTEDASEIVSETM